MGNLIEEFIRKKKSFQKIRITAYMHNATQTLQIFSYDWTQHTASQHTTHLKANDPYAIFKKDVGEKWQTQWQTLPSTK